MHFLTGIFFLALLVGGNILVMGIIGWFAIAVLAAATESSKSSPPQKKRASVPPDPDLARTRIQSVPALPSEPDPGVFRDA